MQLICGNNIINITKPQMPSSVPPSQIIYKKNTNVSLRIDTTISFITKHEYNLPLKFQLTV